MLLLTKVTLNSYVYELNKNFLLKLVSYKSSKQINSCFIMSEHKIKLKIFSNYVWFTFLFNKYYIYL